MRIGWAVPSILALLGGLQEKAPARDLSWLAGCWQGTSDGATIEEHWMTPAGGVMLGIGRVVQDGKTVFSEFLKIVETKDGPEYRVLIEGRPEVKFKLKSRSDDEVIFENPKHDSPRTIGYRKQKDGLMAWIEGIEDGKPTKTEFRFTKKKD